MSADAIWKPLCDAEGFRQVSATRTRGMKPWIQVYRRCLCMECLHPSDYTLSLAASRTWPNKPRSVVDVYRRRILLLLRNEGACDSIRQRTTGKQVVLVRP
jgi:hypothetical protein